MLATRFGVSLENVVATSEMPVSHHGTERPEAKNSDVLLPERFPKARAGRKQIKIQATAMTQSIGWRIILVPEDNSRLRKLFLSAFVAAFAWCQVPQQPVPIAHQALNLLIGAKYADLRGMFNAQMLSAVSEDALQKTVGPQIAALGQPATFGDPVTQNVNGVTAVVFPGRFPAGNFNFVISVDASGKIAGLFLQPGPPSSGQAPGGGRAPTWTRPDYSVPANFRERNVTVVNGAFRLPGTLTIPISPGQHPAIVLVQGSGPEDRDESAFAYKPFRDLAEGLASRGIVVLRYDKRTFAYQPPPSMQGFTAEAETVGDAVSALTLLGQQPEVNPNQVYLLGHSLGGYLAARIAARDPKLAGLVIMSGSARPLEDVILEQNQHAGAPAEQMRQVQQQVAGVKGLQAGQQSTSDYFGLPASYWLDLKGYNPAAQAATLRCRILILQGQRDFQATTNDYSLWQSGLRGDRNATFHLYPTLNHFLVTGQGTGSLSEYNVPGHVALQVINDIANWIKSAQ